MQDVQVLAIYSSLYLGSFCLLVLDTSTGDRKGFKKKKGRFLNFVDCHVYVGMEIAQAQNQDSNFSGIVHY